MEVIIGCVGKPSVGKSTFFNAVSGGQAKTGNFPFTTIEPNTGVTFYRVPCPCVSHGKVKECKPKYGRCMNGTRLIPVKLLDVAGLVPGASEGAGLGNKFLDDLRHADVLMHILDVSGTTNEKGETTVGYDPINDAEWLHGEVHAWVFNNLWKKWSSVARRHAATKASVGPTLLGQLSGYGANPAVINAVLDKMGVRDPVDLGEWDEDQVKALVEAFLLVRFPTILLLNKADQAGDTDKNISRIVERYEASKCFVASAGAECFLKICRQKNVIKYQAGASNFETIEDIEDDLDFRKARGETVPSLEEATAGLEPPDGKTKKRLEKIRDMVLFRYQSTGVWAAIQAAVDLQEPVVVYPVKSLSNFATAADGGGVFGNAMLVKPGSTVRSVVGYVASGMMDLLQYAELLEEGGNRRRVGEDYVLTGKNNIIKFFFRPVEERQVQGGSSQGKEKEQQKARPKKDKGVEGENGSGEGGEM
ncbi:hypothetical protein VYU27_002521 [Nannochloropsis oceanica]